MIKLLKTVVTDDGINTHEIDMQASIWKQIVDGTVTLPYGVSYKLAAKGKPALKDVSVQNQDEAPKEKPASKNKSKSKKD